MARIDLKTSQIGSFGTGDLQLQNGVAMDATLRLVTDAVNTASPLKLSTNLVQTISTLKITTADNPYIDAEDNSGNNRFTVGRDPLSQQVNLDFASNPTGSTTAVGAIRTYRDGVNLSEAMTFIEDGSIGVGTTAPVGLLDLYKAAAATRLAIRGDAGQNRLISYRTGAVQRFGLYVNNTAESGANAGSDFAIRAYNDAGTLLSTPLFINRATGNVGVGTTTTSARLQVRGDGTNPVARFESSAGANFLLINNSGQAVFGSAGANEPYLVNYNGTLTESGTGHSLRIRQRANTGSTGNTLIQYWADGLFSGTTSGIAISHEFLSSGFSGAAGSGNYRNLSIGYTINNSGAQTGTATGIFLNATETALNGQTHNLIDLQVGGSSKFSVNNFGSTTISGALGVSSTLQLGGGGGSILSSTGSGIIRLTNTALTDFSRLQLGGTTSSFPSIKRNGTAIDIRLADDSGFATLNCGNISAISGGIIGGNGGVALGFTYVGSEVANNGFYGWSATTTVSATMDTNLSRISAGLVGVGTGTTSNVLGGISLSRIIAAGLPTARPATVGEFYQDTAANILANGDKVVGIRQ